MPARLLFGTGGGQHIISEDPAASTATAGTAQVRLHLKDPFIPVTRDRDSYRFTVIASVEATDAADKTTARELVLTQLLREFDDLVFEQEAGVRRISMRTSTGEVIKWLATTTEKEGHLATVIEITFIAVLRAQSGGGGTDPILNPPGLINEIVWDHYLGPEGRASWTITALFAGDGSSSAYILANEWARDLDAARPPFLGDKFERVEKRTTLNGLTGETRINLIYSIPTLVLDESADTPETPAKVTFSDYNVQIAPNDQVDIAVSTNPKIVTVTGFVIVRAVDDTDFDPDDPPRVDPGDVPAKIQAAITVLRDRALQVNGIDPGGDVVEFTRIANQVESGARTTFQLAMVVDSNGFIKATQVVRRRKQDRSVIMPDDSARDWIYPPAQSVRITATQEINVISADAQENPFPVLAGLRCFDEQENDPVIRNFVLPDSSGNFTLVTPVEQRQIMRFYIKVNAGEAGGAGFGASGGLGSREGEDQGLFA